MTDILRLHQLHPTTVTGLAQEKQQPAILTMPGATPGTRECNCVVCHRRNQERLSLASGSVPYQGESLQTRKARRRARRRCESLGFDGWDRAFAAAITASLLGLDEQVDQASADAAYNDFEAMNLAWFLLREARAEIAQEARTMFRDKLELIALDLEKSHPGNSVSRVLRHGDPFELLYPS